VDGQAAIEIERPRSIWELIRASIDLFFRVPVLFLVLAAVVMVPYEAIVLLVTGAGPLALGHTGFITSQLVSLANNFLATPLISAFHVHAVRQVGDGERPRLIPTFRQSFSTLAVVVLATGISWAGSTIGFLALAVPGFLLLTRWAVVAQAAALEGGGWTDALRRSADLTDGRRWHAFGLLLSVGVIALVPSLALSAAFGHKSTTVASFAAGTGLEIVVRSFGALATALLYFDLKARFRARAADPADTGPAGTPSARADHADGDLAAGWYVDPSQPTRMRYWTADGEQSWSEHTAKTPKPLLREWEERRQAGLEAITMATDEHAGHSLDPGVYSDEGRPPGWYVDPDRPWRMRYWRTGDQGWSKETTKTPEKAQAEWRDLRWRR
jgi:Protein of unknown function (DUF2510)